MMILMDTSSANNKRIAIFWSKVDTSGGEDACWPWRAGVFSQTGYGQTQHPLRPYNASGNTTSCTAHSVAWELVNGEVGSYEGPGGKPIKLRVRHQCPGGPNRLCCNPAHLRLGSDRDNAGDRIKQKGEARGERVGNSVLNLLLVEEIRRRRFIEGEPVTDIANDLGLPRTTVSSVVNYHVWSWVDLMKLIDHLPRASGRDPYPHLSHYDRLQMSHRGHKDFDYELETFIHRVMGTERVPARLETLFESLWGVLYDQPFYAYLSSGARIPEDLDERFNNWLGRISVEV